MKPRQLRGNGYLPDNPVNAQDWEKMTGYVREISISLSRREIERDFHSWVDKGTPP